MSWDEYYDHWYADYLLSMQILMDDDYSDWLKSMDDENEDYGDY